MQLSIVIPAFNEALHIRQCVAAARCAAEATGRPHEIIVVNDASEDDTAARARAAGARVIDVNRRQIAAVRNAGAAAATGELLVFIDGDTLVKPATLIATCDAVDRGFVAGGAPVAFDAHADLPAGLAVALWNFISRVRRLAAGSYLFVTRQAFEAVGGFDEALFAAEEVNLSRRLHRRWPFAIVSPAVVTSSRKLRTHRWTDHFITLFRVLLTRGRALRSREHLHLWYDGQRTERP